MSKLKVKNHLFFQQICGYEYTLKLLRMFQDTSVSKNLNNQYRTYCENRHLNDIGMKISNEKRSLSDQRRLSCFLCPSVSLSETSKSLEGQRPLGVLSEDMTVLMNFEHLGRY